MAALPRILYAWELGANFGHISMVIETMRPMVGGAALLFAAQNLVSVRKFETDVPFTLLQAPICPEIEKGDSKGVGRSYADVLRHVGWAEVPVLSALEEAWGSLLDEVRPDVLVAQAAPTALLAARGRNVKTAILGGGYDAPPRATPMPPFLFWEGGEDKKKALFAREAEILANANEVLARRNAPPLPVFSDLLQADEYLLATSPEIDPYHPRQDWEPDHPRYLGPLITLYQGIDVSWRRGAKARVFAYLEAGKPPFFAALDALTRLSADIDVVLAAPKAPPEIEDRLEDTHVRLFKGAVRLDRLLPDCDVAVSHASNGVSAAFVHYGIPQLGLPTHSEQLMVGRAIAAQKLGLTLFGQYTGKEVLSALNRLLADDMYKKASMRAAKAPENGAEDATRQACADAIMRLAVASS